jgi:hypothetical protein
LNNTDDVLGQVVELMAANTNKVGVPGEQAMVLGKFLEAVLPHLTTLQRIEGVTRSFRRGIEEALSWMHDVALPVEYHSALLELTNTVAPQHADRRYPSF